MRVYLMRHGTAAPKEQDPERSLTEEGRREAEAAAAAVARTGPAIREIWHSRMRRAAETAALLAGRLSGAGYPAAKLREHAGLGPESSVAPVLEELEKRSVDVALVGHLPFLSRLAGSLLGVDPNRAFELLDFEPAGVLCLDRTDGGWSIRWFLTSEISRLNHKLK